MRRIQLIHRKVPVMGLSPTAPPRNTKIRFTAQSRSDRHVRFNGVVVRFYFNALFPGITGIGRSSCRQLNQNQSYGLVWKVEPAII